MTSSNLKGSAVCKNRLALRDGVLLEFRWLAVDGSGRQNQLNKIESFYRLPLIFYIRDNVKQP